MISEAVNDHQGIMKKTYTIGQMKKKAWKVFSEYIRLRDCIASTKKPDLGICITCNGVFPYTQLQAGHLLDGRIGMNFLDERGVFAQCMICNVWKHGNKEVYIPWFLDHFGKKLFDELTKLKRTPCKWKQTEYEQFIIETKNKIKTLKEAL
jgi:hypothetical protein